VEFELGLETPTIIVTVLGMAWVMAGVFIAIRMSRVRRLRACLDNLRTINPDDMGNSKESLERLVREISRSFTVMCDSKVSACLKMSTPLASNDAPGFLSLDQIRAIRYTRIAVWPAVHNIGEETVPSSALQRLYRDDRCRYFVHSNAAPVAAQLTRSSEDRSLLVVRVENTNGFPVGILWLASESEGAFDSRLVQTQAVQLASALAPLVTAQCDPEFSRRDSSSIRRVASPRYSH
jgi:hypothetical protein